MWNMECVIKPVTRGVIGVLGKRIKENMEATVGKLWLDSVQKKQLN
jgi:hypothetical protein